MVTQHTEDYRDAVFTARAVRVLLEAVAEGRTEGLHHAIDAAERLGGRIGQESDTSLLALFSPTGMVYGIVWHEASKSWGVHS